MIDTSPPAGSQIDDHRLLVELRAIDDQVLADAREMERLAGLAAPPEAAALSTARLRFSRSLRSHLQHVDGAILPYLRANTDARAKPAIDAYRRLLHDYHEAAAHHVARWPSTSVAPNWDGYSRSVADMLARLRERVAIERRDIHPLFARTGPR